MPKKAAANQFNLFGGVGTVTQTEVMSAPVESLQSEKRLEGAYLNCGGCKAKSRVVYIPIDEIPPKEWQSWVAKQVGWPDDCPACTQAL